MTGAVRGTGDTGARRRPAARLGLAIAALVLTGCPSPAQEADRTTIDRPAPPTGAEVSPPVPVAHDDGRTASRPAVTVDLAPGSTSPAEIALDVAGSRDGGAAVLMAFPRSGSRPRVVLVSADGTRTRSVPVPGIASAWRLHLPADGTALVTGRLTGEPALGYAVVDLRAGVARTVASVPLDEATSRTAGASTISPDGRTVWLYSLALVDGRFMYLLTGHDVATGELLAARDLFPELRGLHVPVEQLDLAGLGPGPDGGVVLAVNAFPPGAAAFPRPTLLVYDSSLEPRTAPLALAARGAPLRARALAMTADGTAFVVVRGATSSSLVAVPPDGGPPQPRLELAGFGLTDELVLDRHGRAVLPGHAGARSVDLATGATVDVDLGCPSVVTVRAMATSPVAGTWVAGGCFEDDLLRARVWRIP